MESISCPVSRGIFCAEKADFGLGKQMETWYDAVKERNGSEGGYERQGAGRQGPQRHVPTVPGAGLRRGGGRADGPGLFETLKSNKLYSKPLVP